MSQKHKLYFYYDYVFPNFILPNGLNKEMAIINYIHSQYNNNGSGDAFLERDVDKPDSMIRQIFGEHMGHWPTSIRHGGPHFKYECYNDIIDITEESIHLGRYRHKKYIYPIKISPHINDFLGTTWSGQKIIGDSFWKNISEQALTDIRNGDAILLLDWAQENYLNFGQLVRFNNLIEEANLPVENVILAHNGFNLQEEYEKLFPVEQRRMTVKNWPFLMFHNSWYWNRYREFILSEKQFLESKNIKREHHFLLRIRRSRSYRIALLYKLASDNLLDYGDWSMLDTGLNEQNGFNMANEFMLGYDTTAVQNLHRKFPHKLKSEPDSSFNTISGWGDTKSTHSMTSYFDITTETYMEGTYKSFTEKVCKPLMNFQPFVLISFCGALKMLRELGFKTFDGFIDESYDNEPNHVLRLNKAYKEIEKLAKMSKDQIHDWYWKMEEILMHNHKTFLNFHKTDRYNLDLIEYLEKRISDV
jgi:hypothetical protein